MSSFLEMLSAAGIPDAALVQYVFTILPNLCLTDRRAVGERTDTDDALEVEAASGEFYSRRRFRSRSTRRSLWTYENAEFVSIIRAEADAENRRAEDLCGLDRGRRLEQSRFEGRPRRGA